MFLANVIEEADNKNELIIEQRKIGYVINQLASEKAEIIDSLRRAEI